MGEVECKTSIAVIETKIEAMSVDIIELKDMLSEHVTWEEHKYKDMEKSFAGKWVEKIVIGVVLVAMTAIITLISRGFI
jgi:nucleoside diphosphate kinase